MNVSRNAKKLIVLITFIPFNDLAPSNTQKIFLITFQFVNLVVTTIYLLYFTQKNDYGQFWLLEDQMLLLSLKFIFKAFQQVAAPSRFLYYVNQYKL